jgi:F420-dependent methylenetetrahydromethanopterin dehydrogenase
VTSKKSQTWDFGWKWFKVKAKIAVKHLIAKEINTLIEQYKALKENELPGVLAIQF